MKQIKRKIVMFGVPEAKAESLVNNYESFLIILNEHSGIIPLEFFHTRGITFPQEFNDYRFFDGDKEHTDIVDL